MKEMVQNNKRGIQYTYYQVRLLNCVIYTLLITSIPPNAAYIQSIVQNKLEVTHEQY